MKPPFPASYSTLCPDALAELLANVYPLKDVRGTFLARGVSDTYLAVSGYRFLAVLHGFSHYP